MVLAHTPPEAVVKAYRTSDFFEHRQPIMQEWADFLTETMGPVISPIPTQTEVGRAAQMIKAETIRVQTHRVDPITAAEYELIVQTAQQSEPQGASQQVTLPGAVDVAAIGLMRDALLMTNQAAAARWCDLQREEDGSGRLINIRSSRTAGSGMDHVAYVSARTMAALDEMWNIQRELGMDAADNRLFQIGSDHLRQRIKKRARPPAGRQLRYIFAQERHVAGPDPLRHQRDRLAASQTLEYTGQGRPFRASHHRHARGSSTVVRPEAEGGRVKVNPQRPSTTYSGQVHISYG